MNDEVLKRVDALAAKLGVVSTHLWEILVHQQYVEGVLSLIWAVFGLSMMAISYIAYRLGNKEHSCYRRDSRHALAMSLGLAGIAIFMAGMTCAILNFANPEAEALKELLSTIRG